jgi:hypothetical protein
MKKIKVKFSIFFWLLLILVDKNAETIVNRAFEGNNQITTDNNQWLTYYKKLNM